MTSVPGSLKKAALVARTLGPKWVCARGIYETRRRTGLIRRQLPVDCWSNLPLRSWLTQSQFPTPEHYAAYRREGAPKFFFDPADRGSWSSILKDFDGDSSVLVTAADRILYGVFRFFSHLDIELGDEPNWHRNAVSGEVAPADIHWSLIEDFSYGDIKVIWEPSRFGWAYDLVRAYWRTGDERYPQRFWTLLEYWREANQPNRGPNWKCGQETSLRVMAWCFALYGFLHAEVTTPSRITLLTEMIAFSGKRIESTLGYAISQRNNHGVSEGMGLWTIGSLFPEFRDAARWRKKGKRVLEELGRTLIYDDGAFSQHSTNYHRLALHDFVWSIRLGEVLDDPFSEPLRQRVHTSTTLLFQLMANESGELPNYGANDGALILPLSSSDYSDYRPVISSARYLTTGNRTWTNGPFAEEMFWLFGPKALNAPVDTPTTRELHTETSGYVTMRSPSSMVFTRAPNQFLDRPTDADVLALDLWWRGNNIAMDAGSYSYNSDGAWNQGLRGTCTHNAVTVDGHDQMDRVGRFLWAPWVRADRRVKMKSENGFFSYFEASHDGFQRLPNPVTYTRSIIGLGDDLWLIGDVGDSDAAHAYQLHWLLDQGFSVAGSSEKGIRLRYFDTGSNEYNIEVGTRDARLQFEYGTADESSVRGWRSLRYLEKQPAVYVTGTIQGQSARFWTVMGPGDFRCDADDKGISIVSSTVELQGTWGQGKSLLSRLVAISKHGTRIDSISLPSPG